MPPAAWRYQQLADELSTMVEGGILQPGDRLPSVRRLAREKRLSLSTAVQALRQLEERGLVEARPQSGFFVRPPVLAEARLARLDAATRKARPVTVDICNRLVGIRALNYQRGMVPLGAALPAGELLPIAALQTLYRRVARDAAELLDSASHVWLNRRELVRQLVRQSMNWGPALAAEELIVTNSCTESLALCLRAVTRPGDTVAVESPSYYLMLELLENMGLKAIEIPTHPRDGLSVDALDLATRERRIAACLLVSNFSNPLGSLMPDTQKRRLAALMAERQVPVIEDDVFGDLHFGVDRPWPVKSFDTAGNVLLCSSTSKTLSPSLRLGYVAAGRYQAQVEAQKTLTSGLTNPVTQLVAAQFLASTAYPRHLRGLRRTLQAQVRQMSEGVLRHFPAGTRLSSPQGGLVLWVELPEGRDASTLYDRATAERIAFVPGEMFSASGRYRHCLRLNCGNPMTPALEQAIARLGALARLPAAADGVSAPAAARRPRSARRPPG